MRSPYYKRYGGCGRRVRPPATVGRILYPPVAVCGNIIIIKEDYEFLNPCTRSHSVTTRLRAMQEKIAERAKLWYKKDNKFGKEVFPMPEMLDIVDENGVPTGQSVPRTTAHAEGLRHRTSHVWIVRRKNGRVQVLLQMRCAAKDSYPGCYDISSAGHIPAGAEFVGSGPAGAARGAGRDRRPRRPARMRPAAVSL